MPVFCCPSCQVTWLEENKTSKCWVCEKDGRGGDLGSYCSHGTKKVPNIICPECVNERIEERKSRAARAAEKDKGEIRGEVAALAEEAVM